MADGDSIHFATASTAVPARTTTGNFTVTVKFADDLASAMENTVYVATADLYAPDKVLSGLSLRGISAKTSTSITVSLSNSATLAANVAWINVIIFPTS